MTAAGLIFSNIHDQSIPQMTATRTMASLPFGGRYRLVDFALSNMVNSGITKVGIVTHNNYRSLMDHIGTGKDWDTAAKEPLSYPTVTPSAILICLLFWRSMRRMGRTLRL